ncbi:MAG: NDP-sugar synthase, partial [Anaerolineaceae bacterium]|nr:NDP-sugar synthase [Anaerolineaceae bacterium]
MHDHLSIALPMAGWGTRMRPHTWSRPKALCHLAGKTTLDYVLQQFKPLSAHFSSIQYIFIISSEDHQKQIETHMRAHHPDLDVVYVLQTEMNGQSGALKLTQQWLKGPTLMAFADTLIDADFTELTENLNEGIAWCVKVNEPQHYGIARVEAHLKFKLWFKFSYQQYVVSLKEKPEDPKFGNLAMVGTYFFPSGEGLISAIDRQMERGIKKDADDPNDAQTREYFIAPAINILINEDKIMMKTSVVDKMYDAGRPEPMLVTNQHLLELSGDNSKQAREQFSGDNVELIPPVYVAPNAQLENVQIGPNVSIGSGTSIRGAKISNSIIGEDTLITGAHLDASLIGDRVQIHLPPEGADSILTLNLGDDASLNLIPRPQIPVECISSAHEAEQPVALYW